MQRLSTHTQIQRVNTLVTPGIILVHCSKIQADKLKVDCCRVQKDMYDEREPRAIHVNTHSLNTPQNIIPDLRNEIIKQSRIYLYVIIALKFVHYIVIVCT